MASSWSHYSKHQGNLRSVLYHNLEILEKCKKGPNIIIALTAKFANLIRSTSTDGMIFVVFIVAKPYVNKMLLKTF